MSLEKIHFPPGLLQVGTDYQRQRWISMNLVRWQNDGAVWATIPQLGWTERLTAVLTGKCRCIWVWVDNDTVRWIGFGTHSKLYVATASDTTAYDITPSGFTAGDADASAGGGYGTGPYGEGTYGTPRPDVDAVQPASVWTLDNFGEILVGCMAEDGNVYNWDPNTGTGTLATQVSGSPTGTAIVVTEEGFLFVLGAAGNARRVQWPDQNTLTTWTPTSTNQAGDIDIVTPGKLMCGKRIRGGTLIWTDQDVHQATYLGQPFIYGFKRVGTNCGIISRGAAIVVDTTAFWMGRNRFYMFDGVTRELMCDVANVFDDLNTTQASKVTAYHEPQFSEVWWYYPSAASTECDRKVGYNYAGGFWLNDEDFDRTAGIARGLFVNPIMVDADGQVYDHETGFSYDSKERFVESGPSEIENGDRLTKVREIVPDEKTQGDVTVTLYGKDSPNGAETTFGPYTMADFVDVRAEARQFRVRYDFGTAARAAVGVFRYDILPGGRR